MKEFSFDIFDVSKTPHSQKTIDEYRKNASYHMREVERKIKYTRYGYVATMFILFILFIIYGSEINNIYWAFIGTAIATFYFTSLVAKILLGLSDKLQRMLKQLDPIDEHSLLAIDRYAKEDATVRTYVDRIDAMGRAPVYGELETAKAWIEGHEKQIRKD